MFQKATPKWFLNIYSVLISLLALFFLVLAANDIVLTPFVAWYTLFFVLFNIAALGYFLGKKYELRSWLVPLAYLVFGFVVSSLTDVLRAYMLEEGVYFLNFIKTIFFLMFVLLVDVLYLHPKVKEVQVLRKKSEVKAETKTGVKPEIKAEVKPVVTAQPVAAVKKPKRKK